MTEMNQNQNAEPAAGQGNGNVPEEAAEAGKKLFTQEEVNAFVQTRLSRYKAQADKESQEAYNQKMAELHQREMKLLVKEKLSERGMPQELAGILTCTDKADLKNKLDTLQRVYGSNAAEKRDNPTGFVQIGAPSGGSWFTQSDPIRKAMGLDGKG